MAVDFAGGYASPTLRKAVFDKLHVRDRLHLVLVLSGR